MGLKESVRNWKRVVQIARKPSKDEFLSTSKVTALGLVLIGAIGFGIFLAFVLIPF